MSKLFDQIQESLAFIRSKTSNTPKVGIVLGTGLGNLADQVVRNNSIPYKDIPHFPVSTVESHKGELIFGELGGQSVVVMNGRFHYYEGYSTQELTFPIRVLKAIGIETILISNASGGLNQHIHSGDLVIVNDHINLIPENPLRGANDERLGIRFPDMRAVYDLELRKKGMEIAQQNHIRCHEGVYVGLSGPSLETPAEYNYLHTIGGDVVGMSTVPEVIVARHAELKTFVVSVCVNMGYPKEKIEHATVASVIKAAQEAEPKLTKLITQLLESL